MDNSTTTKAQDEDQISLPPKFNGIKKLLIG